LPDKSEFIDLKAINSLSRLTKDVFYPAGDSKNSELAFTPGKYLRL